MARFASFVAAIFLGGIPAIAQQFSTEPGYVTFYEAHFNAKFESSQEPAIALLWIIEQFGAPSVPREKLRDLLATHAELFPESVVSDKVASYLKIIQRTLTERRPPDENRIEQLVFDLRDLKTKQYYGLNSAVQYLCDIGYDAIPVLIDHVDDDTLTRVVDVWNPRTHRVLTVGDCCSTIIDRILPTGRLFDVPGDPVTAKQAMKNHYRHLVARKRAEL